MPQTTYAVVQDVPASWDAYLEAVGKLGDWVPDGLLVHVAGPTDEGVRLIDIWESQIAWQNFRSERLGGAAESSTLRTTVRDLVVRHLFVA
jgi:hypothetical protein